MREKIAKIILVLGFILLSPASGLAESILATASTTPGCVGCPGEVFLFKFEGSNPLTALPPIPADLTSSPVYVAFSRKGELFVSSYLGLISRFTFDATGNFTPNGTITGNSLENVHGLAFSPQGELFAANFSNGTISRFLFDAQENATPNGTITVAGYNQGVAFSSNGELFNTDFGSNVRRFRFDTITGEAIPNGIFSVPDASRLHGLAFNSQGELFIADPDNDRVVRFLFDNDGNPVSNGLIPVPGIPLDVTFSPTGELFVSTHQGGGLQRFLFDKNGDAFFNGFTPFEHLGGVAIFTSTTGGGEITTTLTPGISYQGRLLPQQYHRFSLQAQAGKSLLIEVVPEEGVDALSLDGKLGTIPLYAGTGVYTTKTKTPRGHYELVIAPTEAGAYYFSLFGNNVTTAGGSYSITARYVEENYLSDLSRRSAGNNGSITLTLTGLGFTSDTKVTLSTAGLPPIVPTEIVAVSPTSLQVTFNLYGMQPGIYDLGVSLAGAPPSILQQALEVTGGAPAQLHSLIRLPPIVRPSRNYTFWFEYGNEGGSDLSPSLFVVSNDAGAGMRLTANEPFRDTSLQVLGVNLDGPAGYLPPGSSYRIPIYFQVPGGLGSGAEIGFKVEKMVTDATPIDWAAIESQIRPADMDADAWRLVWANFRTQLGNTWADYLRRLNNDATYISRYRRFSRNDAIVFPAIISPLSLTNPTGHSGDTALYDVRTLLQFEFAKATAGISPRTVLAAIQDVYVPAPGLSLTFGRLALPSLPGRFRLGPLGRGWTHSYEYSATLATNGDITIQGPGDSMRLFRSLGNGNYQGLAGDYGNVYFVGDNIVVREKDGIIWQFRSDGKLQSIADTNGNVLTLYYSGENLSHVDHSNGERLTFSYGDHGRINQITDPTGRTIVFHYDSSGEHLNTVEEPGGVVTAYDYYAADGSAVAHALNKITFPDGTHYYYWTLAILVVLEARSRGNDGVS